MNEPSTVVSPGMWGFVAFFVLAVALYFLMRNMNARMRRMSYRAEEAQREAEAEQEERRRRKANGAESDGEEPDGEEQAVPKERPEGSGPDPAPEAGSRHDGEAGQDGQSRQDGEPAP